ARGQGGPPAPFSTAQYRTVCSRAAKNAAAVISQTAGRDAQFPVFCAAPSECTRWKQTGNEGQSRAKRGGKRWKNTEQWINEFRNFSKIVSSRERAFSCVAMAELFRCSFSTVSGPLHSEHVGV